MADKEIKVPNIGEFKGVEVIEILVSKGQLVSKNDPLITIESDKSSVEIPSLFEGKVKSVKIKVGDRVSEGDLILIIEANEVNHSVSEQTKTKTKPIYENKPKKILIKNQVKRFSLASPKTRKFARELGVDIDKISGSEREGRVIESDIKNLISSNINTILEKKDSFNKKIKNEFIHSDFGEVEIKDIPRIKRLASTNLTNSWSTIPHVTNHDEADITEMEEFRSSLTNIYTGEKKKITPLAFIVKALAISLKNFPNFN